MIYLHIGFTIMMALVMTVIACSSILLAKEYISANVYKSARKKLIIINLVAIVGFAVLYPKILDFEYASILIKLVVMWYVLQVFLSIIALLVKIFRLIYEKTSGTKVDESRRRFYMVLFGCLLFQLLYMVVYMKAVI